MPGQPPTYVVQDPRTGMMRPATQQEIQASMAQGPGVPQPAPPAPADPGMGLAGPVVSSAGLASGGAAASYFGGGASAVPTATEGALGFGAGAPTGSAIGTAADGGVMYGSAAAPQSAGLFGASLAPLGVGAIGALTAYEGFQGHKKGQAQGGGGWGGLKAGVKQAGWLNAVPVLGQAAWLGGALGGQFGSKKGKDQRSRDEGRGKLESVGLRDAGNRGFYTLPDGTQVDLSTVGHNGGPSYNLDESQFNNPEFGQDVGTMNALLGAAGGGNGKRTSDLVGESINAFNGHGGSHGAVMDAKAKIEASGGGAGQIKDAAAQAWLRGEITANERDSRFAATDKLYGIKNTSGGRWESGANLDQGQQQRNSQELNQFQKSRPSGSARPPDRTAPKRGR